MISSRDFPGWLIGWSIAIGVAILFLLGGETVNDAIDGWNLAVDYQDWFLHFWYGG